MFLTRSPSTTKFFNITVLVAALGYFVDIYDLLLFGIVRTVSLTDLGITGEANRNDGEFLISMQMYGMLLGGIFWGILGDKKGRLSVLFGSILIYSLANIANSLVQTVNTYAICRFIAGIGLAGELGAGITLVAEILPKEKRGYGTMLVAAIGLLGAIVANLVYQLFLDWRLCYFAGGILGLLLLFLRMNVVESTLFNQLAVKQSLRGNFISLFTSRQRFVKYISCILIATPIWFIIGVLITFAPEFAKAIELPESHKIMAGHAIAWSYGGLVIGDICSGLLSQWMRNRKKVMFLFLSLNLITAMIYLNGQIDTIQQYYGLCFLLGFTAGYWVIFVTIAAEQFGTNLRATVTTTVPNFVRGALPLILLLYQFFRDKIFVDNILLSATVVAILLSAIALFALNGLKETFAVDLNYTEEL